MKPFKIQKILIPIDFSETSMLAIEHAAFTAQLFKADLVLLHVVEKLWEQFSIIQPEIRIAPPDDFINTLEKKLEELAGTIRAKYGVNSTCITTDGNIFNEILSITEEHDIDMVVMGTHGISGVAEFFIGSNTFKVVTLSDCPVLSVQSTTGRVGYKNILLPIDDSAHSRQKVNQAIVLAKHFVSKIHIVGLADSSDVLDLKKFEIKLDQIEEYIKKCGIESTRKTLNGNNQAKMTLDYSGSVNADLVVIMTDQDENITGRFLGSYAQQIVNHSKIPVLSIQPVISSNPWVHPY